MTLEQDCQDILEIFAYHSLCDSVIVEGTDENNNETGGGIKIPLKRSVFNPNSLAYRCLSGLIGFRRPAEFGLYRPRLLLQRPALAPPTAYWLAYQRPGPLGTLEGIIQNFPLSRPEPYYHTGWE